MKEVKIPADTDLNQNQTLARLRIDPNVEILEPPIFCRIGDAPAMTEGNFSLINGKAKSGKTFLTGAIVAALLSSSEQLGIIRGSLPSGKGTVLYIDTEQSPFHAARNIKRICKLTGDPDPNNLYAYGLRPLTPAERLQTIEEALSSTNNLGVVIIDGIRDLLTIGINDEAEATSLTSKFLKWTADYSIHIIILLHQNKTDGNARGHIGTEVVNKAETTITVTKESKQNIFTVSCEYSRDFAFDDFGFIIQDGQITAIDLPEPGQTKGRSAQSIKDDEHIEKLNVIFSKERKLSGADLQTAIMAHFQVGVIRSREFVYRYLLNEWIEKERVGKNVNYVYRRAIF